MSQGGACVSFSNVAGGSSRAGLHVRLREKDMDDHPVTRAELNDTLNNALSEFRTEIRAGMNEALAALEQRLDQRFEGRMDAQEQRMKDFVREANREMETRLLQAFYGFAETNNRRLEQMEGTAATLTNRVSTLEDRILRVEKRLNMPPAA
jgi:predicted  nucleic acid-binding Zn-ribbon protein